MQGFERCLGLESNLFGQRLQTGGLGPGLGAWGSVYMGTKGPTVSMAASIHYMLRGLGYAGSRVLRCSG